MANPSATTLMFRWASVPPAVVLAGFATHLFSRIIASAIYPLLVRAYGVDPNGGGGFVRYLMLPVSHFPWGFALVFAGAWVAPRYRTVTAMLIAIIVGMLSLLTHVLVQQTVGVINYAHFAAETLGAVGAVVAIARWRREVKPSNEPVSPDASAS